MLASPAFEHIIPHLWQDTQICRTFAENPEFDTVGRAICCLRT